MPPPAHAVNVQRHAFPARASHANVRPMTLTTAALTAERWPDVEALFGPRGACAGCWCMFWRLERGERFADLQGEPLKRRFRAGVLRAEIHGVLAYDGGEPVGWVTFGPRPSFPRLQRSPSLACEDAEQVWSIPCFFIRRSHRGQGLGKVLLEAAVAEMRRLGVRLVEGYPVKPPASGVPLPAAFAYTGTRPMFDRAGFRLQAGAAVHSRQRVRRSLRPPVAPGSRARGGRKSGR